MTQEIHVVQFSFIIKDGTKKTYIYIYIHICKYGKTLEVNTLAPKLCQDLFLVISCVLCKYLNGFV